MDISRNPRHAATALGQAFESTYKRPPRGLIFGVGSRGYNAAQWNGQNGYARFYRCGRPFFDKSGGNVSRGDELPPPTSTVNFAAGLTRANHAILPLSSDGAGSLAIRPFVAGGGAVQVIVDVDGYFE